MKHIRNRNDLIEFLEGEITWPAVLRALLHKNELLGAFNRIIANSTIKPGWIIRVTSKTKRQWILGVVPGLFITDDPVIWYLKEIPWKCWVGDVSENPLFQGDNPEKYKSLRDKEL